MNNVIGWGLLLWFLGYALGLIAYTLVPPAYIGYIVMPIGTLVTVWVLLTKRFHSYVHVAIIWTLIAVVFDYLFNVQLFKLTDYYKLDIYLYYILTFVLPLLLRKK